MYARFKYKWRVTGQGLVSPPATVVIANRQRYEKGASYKLTARWIKWVKDNNNEQGIRNVLGKSKGWVNQYANDGTPIAESLSMGGNVAEIEYIEGNFAKLKTLRPDSPMPNVKNPLYSHRMTAVSFPSVPQPFANGVHAYFPFIINGDAWVSLDWIDVFTGQPEPLWPGGTPAELAGYAAVVNANTIVRQRPEVTSPKVGFLTRDLVTRVVSEVRGYAQIGDRMWVELSKVRKI